LHDDNQRRNYACHNGTVNLRNAYAGRVEKLSQEYAVFIRSTPGVSSHAPLIFQDIAFEYAGHYVSISNIYRQKHDYSPSLRINSDFLPRNRVNMKISFHYLNYQSLKTLHFQCAAVLTKQHICLDLKKNNTGIPPGEALILISTYGIENVQQIQTDT